MDLIYTSLDSRNVILLFSGAFILLYYVFYSAKPAKAAAWYLLTLQVSKYCK